MNTSRFFSPTSSAPLPAMFSNRPRSRNRIARGIFLPALAVAVASLVLASENTASAYPQFQLSYSGKCMDCHYSPTGGGLINEFGRFAAESDISRGGNGELLHGLWTPPEWIDFGGDFRFAGLGQKEASNDAEIEFFPMQIDAYARVNIGQVSVNATLGLRGVAHAEDDITVADRFISREHFVMWTPEEGDWYVRAGRYYAPYGLRLVEHTSWVRRDLGFGLYDETYGATVGGFGDNDEWHATVFAPPPFWQGGDPGFGSSFLYERRLASEETLWGTSVQVRRREKATKGAVGAHSKMWFPSSSILLMGELDLIVTKTDNINQFTAGATAYSSGSWYPTTGVLLTLGGEVSKRTLNEADGFKPAVFFQGHYFPWAHFELMTLLRAEPSPRFGGGVATVGFLQLHYYL